MTRSVLLAPLLLAMTLAASAAEHAAPPVSVFQELEGDWRGSFVGYDATGKEIYRIEVTQSFRTVDDETQTVAIEDRMPDGTVTRTRGTHLARRNGSGALELSCDLKRSTGEHVQLQGRLIRGPLGTTEFIWWSASGDRSDTFREGVADEGGKPTYHIDGMGRYGDSLVLMAGRYRKVGDAAAAGAKRRDQPGPVSPPK